MATSLLEAFQELDAQAKHALAEIASPMLLSFAALDIAEQRVGVHRLTVEHIGACLEAAGVAIKRNSVSRALVRAGSKVSTSVEPKELCSFRCTHRGRAYPYRASTSCGVAWRPLRYGENL
jgi:hypothetical protein